MTDAQIADVEEIVNREIFEAAPVETAQKPYAEAVGSGAMALFGEKYGDVVRVVSIPGVSAELCGGTHVRNTSEIGLFRIVAESGIAAGVRRIEAVTGPKAYSLLNETAKTVDELGELVRATPDRVVYKVKSLLDERRVLEKRLEEALRAGSGNEVERIVASAKDVAGLKVAASEVEVADSKELGSVADAVRDRLGTGVAVLAAQVNGKHTLVCVVTDDLRARGVRADTILKEVAAIAGGRGGGKAHMAQAGVPDGSRIGDALAAVPSVVQKQLGADQ
jgi:alanyl-tRNA synthetase